MKSTRRFRPRFERLEDRAVPAVYYVATTGSNAGAGSSAAPWQTLQFAAGRVAPGDTVVVRAGDYVGFDLTTSGTPAAPIAFQADPGARVTARNASTPDGINLEQADWVTIQGFTVVNQPRAGIRVIGDHVTVRGNTCDDNATWGIFTAFSNDLLIEGNTCTRSQAQHGIYTSNSGDRPVIRGNVCWGNAGSGIHMNGDLSQGGDGVITGALVEDNVIHDNGAGGGSGINCDGVQDSVFRNNLVYNEHASGLSLYRIDGGGPSTGNVVENNTLLAASDGRWALNIADGATGTAVRNNILYSAQGFRGAITVTADSLAGLASDYNAVENALSADGGNTAIGLAAWRTATGQDAHSFTIADPTPLFVNAVGGDYHQAITSPTIDKGTATGAPPTDFEGTPRPSGAGYDIGFDEYVPNTPPPPPPPLPPPPPNTAPSISNVTDRTVPAGGTTGPLGFTVADAETPAGSLVVTAASSNAALVPLSGITLGGTGGKRTVTVTPAARMSGAAVVTLTVTDGGGLTAADTFTVTVPPVAPPPPPPPGPPAPPPAPPAGSRQFAVGADAGSSAVQFYNPDGSLRFTVDAFPGFTGGVRTAAADFNGDGVADLVVGTGPGGPTRVRVLDGVTRQELFSVQPFEAGFTGGVFVAAGDLDGNGVADLVVTPDRGGGPRARVFSGAGFGLIADFFGIDDPGFRGGARAAVGDVNGDGVADLLVAAGFGGGPRVAGFDGKSLATGPVKLFADFFVFEQTLRNGVFVTAGDLDGDGLADVVVGGGPGGGPRASAFSGRALVQTGAAVREADFFAGDTNNRGGVRVAVKDLDGDNKADLVTGSGAGGGSRVTAYSGTALATGNPTPALDFDAFPGYTGGVFVG